MITFFKESKKYSSKIEMYKKSRTAYNHMIGRELTNICFLILKKCKEGEIKLY